jgi:serine/threonine protein kinase
LTLEPREGNILALESGSSESTLEGVVLAGKYRVGRRIGKGAMGVVYAADHVVLGTRVAIKVLLPEAASSRSGKARFLREARAASRIRCDHVVRVFDVGEHAGRPFLVMDLLEGADLATVAARGLRPVHEVVRWLIQALDGVARAHALGIVHRDLKPSNLFLARTAGGDETIKILDFGISKHRDEDATLTATSAALGSPAYMAPEQIRDGRAADPRSDLWSLGVIAYELVAGTRPFSGSNAAEVFAAILERTPPLLHERCDGVPEGLSRIVARCLQRNPVHRYTEAAHLASALQPFAAPTEPSGRPRVPAGDTSLEATCETTLEGSLDAVRAPRRRAITAVAAAAGVAVAVAVMTLAVRPGESPLEPRAVRGTVVLREGIVYSSPVRVAAAPTEAVGSPSNRTASVLGLTAPRLTAPAPPDTAAGDEGVAARDPLRHRE